MFDVLAFVYEHYDGAETCPEPALLQRKLSAVGFESDEIHEAITWLQPLLHVESGLGGLSDGRHAPHPSSVRVFSAPEQRALGPQCLGYLIFLEHSGVLTAAMRELVLDRAQATGSRGMALADFKWVVLLVMWRFGQEPDALVLDELYDDGEDRICH